MNRWKNILATLNRQKNFDNNDEEMTKEFDDIYKDKKNVDNDDSETENHSKNEGRSQAEVADRIWLTCCALHNLLLDVDGLSSGWQSGVPSHWKEASGEFELDDVPESIRRLINPDAIQNYDRSSCGYNANVPQDQGISDDDNSDMMTAAGQEVILHKAGEMIAVNALPMHQFRAMLIENLNILFHQHKIKLPQRLIAHVPCNVPVV